MGKRLCCSVSLLFFVFCTACSKDNPASGQELVKSKCFTCHSRLIVCKNLDQGDKYWKNTVERMAKKDMEISPESVRTVIDFLQRQEPDSSVLCQ